MKKLPFFVEILSGDMFKIGYCFYQKALKTARFQGFLAFILRGYAYLTG
jgi:hypothetical protein